jgi:hypothetical protein
MCVQTKYGSNSYTKELVHDNSVSWTKKQIYLN